MGQFIWIACTHFHHFIRNSKNSDPVLYAIVVAAVVAFAAVAISSFFGVFRHILIRNKIRSALLDFIYACQSEGAKNQQQQQQQQQLMIRDFHKWKHVFRLLSMSSSPTLNRPISLSLSCTNRSRARGKALTYLKLLECRGSIER